MVGVGNKLYTAGGWGYGYGYRIYHDRACQSAFHVYYSKQNQWLPLQPMLRSCHSLALVHHMGFIYAIGGQDDEDSPTGDFQCYDIVQECWADLTPMPFRCYEVSAVAFRNKILVSGIHSPTVSDTNHVVMIYYPVKDNWEIIENVIHWTNVVPMLHIHKDQCYRVLRRYKSGLGDIGVTSVNVLDCNSQVVSDEVVVTTTCIDNVVLQDGTLEAFITAPIVEEVSPEVEMSVTIGKEIKQDHIPEGSGAFRINDEVFMIKKGFAYKTDVRIPPSQSSDVDLDVGRWAEFNGLKEEFYVSNVTYLTFDKKKLTGGIYDYRPII